MTRNRGFEKSRFQGEHELLVRGDKISFDSIAEDYIIYDENGQQEASMFSFSYLKKDVAPGSHRPVMFVFDGGPGVGSAAAQLGFFAPWTVKQQAGSDNYPDGAPYEMEDNPNCILDICDIVAVDTVGTGYARLFQQEKASYYYSVDGDAESIADFVEDWLTTYHRWNCPIYLAGTSYGCIRVCRAVEHLEGGYFFKGGSLRSVPIAGVVLIGNSITIDMTSEAIFPDNFPGVPNVVTLLPTMAATKWFHFDEARDCSLEEQVEKAYRFAVDKLEPCLKGNVKYNTEEKFALAKEMSDLIGLPAELIMEKELSLNDLMEFAYTLLGDRGLDVGVYNSTMTLPSSQSAGVLDPAGDDAGEGQMSMAIVSVFNSDFKERLGITFDRPYEYVNFGANQAWKLLPDERLIPEVPARSTAECLVAAMRRNQRMKLLVAMGYYDFGTVYGASRIMVERMQLPVDRTIMKGYAAGHYVYVSKRAAEQLGNDIRDMIRG